MKQMGYSDALVGVVASTEWLGLAVATPFVALWVKQLGLSGAFLLSGLIQFGSYLLITVTPWPLVWGLLIFLSGVASCMRWIVAEACVAELATERSRGRTVGIFGTMISATYIAGPAILSVIGTQGIQARYSQITALALAALAVLLGAAMPRVTSKADKLSESPARLGLMGILDASRTAPILLVSGLFGGFFDAGSTGLLPLFGLSMGIEGDQSALLISACGLGGVLIMWPVGLLADRYAHRPIYLGCGAIAVVSCLTMLLVPLWHPLAFVIALVWGGCGGASYTLAMVDAGKRGTGVELVNLTAVLILSYTIGGMIAPLMGGAALSLVPFWGLPILMTSFAAVVTLFIWNGEP